MFSEDDLLPLSALQHLVFCERQWALIHLEGIWEENRLTVEGRHLHERTDSPGTEVRGDLRIARGLRLRSLRLGLVGQADVVEFHRLPDDTPPSSPGRHPLGFGIEDIPGLWRPFPVEYKRGKPKPDRSDEVQICAQALCLEDMLDTEVPAGALFYGRTHRRHDVTFDVALRTETETLATHLHELFRRGETPPAKYEKKCKSCSLLSACMPRSTGTRPSAEKYLAAFFEEIRTS